MARRDYQAVAVTEAREQLAAAAKLTVEGKLEAAREALTTGEYNTQSDDFPDTKRWTANSQLLTALREFDLAHPEVIVEIRRAASAANPFNDAAD